MKKQSIITLLIIIIASIFYFMYPVTIQPDSTDYIKYLNIFNGLSPLSTWDVVRGPIFPVIIYLFTLIFGNNLNAYMLCTFLFFLMYIVTILWIIKKETSNNMSHLKKYFLISLVIILLIFNPVIYGYMRTIMTECVAFPLILISCYLNYKFINTDTRRKILHLIINSIIMIIMWFLKQPFIVPVFAAFLISLIIDSVINKKTINILKNFASLIISLVFFVASVGLWKNFLVNNGVDYNSGRNNNYFLTNSFIQGNSNIKQFYEENLITEEFIINDSHLSEGEKSRIINILNQETTDKFTIFYIYDASSNLIDKKVLFTKEENPSMIEALSFLISNYIDYPLVSLDSYIANYLATINIYQSVRNGQGNYEPYKKIGYYVHENDYAALYHLNSDTNFLWMRDDISQNVSHLETDINNYGVINDLIEKYSYIGKISFQIAFLLLPFLSIYSIIKFVKTKNKRYCFAVILFMSALLYILFLCFTGAIIDRYAYSLYPEIVLGVYLLMNKKKEVIMKKEKAEKSKNPKILFVIPAYNEAENIGNVLKEIKRDVDYADILVINDCSKDNTKEIVENNNVKCITNVFNMRYAMAVQTGIKYAYENDYDYVIQFDADGQHIAKEAEKLFKTIQKENCDIVIGSRYLEDTGYPCPLFRRIGTKIFEFLVKIFCHQKIADPLSGFQCLNRRVIEKYAQMGKYPEFPDANLIIEMIREGYEVREIPVKMRLREAGESMHGGIIKPIKYMINMFYTIVFIVISTPRAKESKDE